MSGELAPIGPEMGRRNRRLIAERTGWPKGAVEACEAIERDHPGWRVDYMHESNIRGFEHAAGFYGVIAINRREERTVYGATAEELTEEIEKG